VEWQPHLKRKQPLPDLLTDEIEIKKPATRKGRKENRRDEETSGKEIEETSETGSGPLPKKEYRS